MRWRETKTTEPAGVPVLHQVTVALQERIVPMELRLQPEVVEHTTGVVLQPEAIHRQAIVPAGVQGVTNPLEGPPQGPATIVDPRAYQEAQVPTEAVEAVQGARVVIGAPVEVAQEALVELVDLQGHPDLAGEVDHNSQ